MADSKTNIPVIAAFSDKCLILKIRQETIDERGLVYEAVRHAWRLAERRTETEYVLAVVDGMVRGVYKDIIWRQRPEIDKWEFSARDADNEVCARYLGRLIPPEYRGPKEEQPVRYTW